MILFTGGFPYSGKTKLIETLSTELKHKLVLHINPKRWLPDDYKTLYDEDKQIWNISAWELGLERAFLGITKMPNQALIVLDTAASRIDPLLPLIKDSKKRGHTVIYVYVHSSAADRKERASDQARLIEKLEIKYAADFKTAIPQMKSLADEFVIIKNESEQTLLDGARNLAQLINTIRDN